jgi:hypothetical protein
VLTGGSGGSGCNALEQTVLQTLDAAERCGVGGPPTQCTDALDGLCCPVLVADKDSDASVAYEKALGAFRDAGCAFQCPPKACDFMPLGVCAPIAPMSSTYHCSSE